MTMKKLSRAVARLFRRVFRDRSVFTREPAEVISLDDVRARLAEIERRQ